jgi:hypothetical protein
MKSVLTINGRLYIATGRTKGRKAEYEAVDLAIMPAGAHVVFLGRFIYR